MHCENFVDPCFQLWYPGDIYISIYNLYAGECAWLPLGVPADPAGGGLHLPAARPGGGGPGPGRGLPVREPPLQLRTHQPDTPTLLSTCPAAHYTYVMI